YTYAWSGPAGYTATTEDITGLAAGTYDVTVTDANGCTQTGSFTVALDNVTITITPTLITNTVCTANNGAIDITVAGGTAPYTYAWSGPAGYTATTEDITGL